MSNRPGFDFRGRPLPATDSGAGERAATRDAVLHAMSLLRTTNLSAAALAEVERIESEWTATPDADDASDHEHHSKCYQRAGVPDGLPADLCDCRVLRTIDAASTGASERLSEAERESHRLALLRAVVSFVDTNGGDLPLGLLDSIRAEIGGPR